MAKTYSFLDLKPEAQKRAYDLYCEAMNDDLNRDHIVSLEDYGAEADWDLLEFDEQGNGIE